MLELDLVLSWWWRGDAAGRESCRGAGALATVRMPAGELKRRQQTNGGCRRHSAARPEQKGREGQSIRINRVAATPVARKQGT